MPAPDDATAPRPWALPARLWRMATSTLRSAFVGGTAGSGLGFLTLFGDRSGVAMRYSVLGGVAIGFLADLSRVAIGHRRASLDLDRESGAADLSRCRADNAWLRGRVAELEREVGELRLQGAMHNKQQQTLTDSVAAMARHVETLSQKIRELQP